MKKIRVNPIIAVSPIDLRDPALGRVRGGASPFMIVASPPRPAGTNWD